MPFFFNIVMARFCVATLVYHVSMLLLDEKPEVSYADIGGADMQKQEMREAVELPLTHFELYKQIGIDPPRGVLMYGPPGCGKTMLAKAVAHHTTGNLFLLFLSPRKTFTKKKSGEWVKELPLRTSKNKMISFVKDCRGESELCLVF